MQMKRLKARTFVFRVCFDIPDRIQEYYMKAEGSRACMNHDRKPVSSALSLRLSSAIFTKWLYSSGWCSFQYASTPAIKSCSEVGRDAKQASIVFACHSHLATTSAGGLSTFTTSMNTLIKRFLTRMLLNRRSKVEEETFCPEQQGTLIIRKKLLADTGPSQNAAIASISSTKYHSLKAEDLPLDRWRHILLTFMPFHVKRHFGTGYR